MAIVSHKSRNIHAKILYVGPRGSGKTTNLRSIYEGIQESRRSARDAFVGEPGPTTSFDFLPIYGGEVHGYTVKLHLYSVCPLIPEQNLLSVLMHGVDGLIFVADSDWNALGQNILAWKETQQLLRHNHINLDELTLLFQLNKQDLVKKCPPHLLASMLGIADFDQIHSTATNSGDALSCLEAISRKVLKRLSENEGTRN